MSSTLTTMKIIKKALEHCILCPEIQESEKQLIPVALNLVNNFLSKQ